MPFKSKAQQRFMFSAEAKGDLPKGTAKKWAKHTRNIKGLPEKVADEQHPDLPQFGSAQAQAWTQGVATPDGQGGIDKCSGFMAGFRKTAGLAIKPLKMPVIKPMKSLVGSTDKALGKYNAKVVSGRTPLSTGSTEQMKGIVERSMKKEGSGNLAQDACDEANLNRNMDVFVPGSSLRANAETGQTKGKSYRTPGVQNENKEFSKQFKTTAQTARGGKNYGGTIGEMFSADGNQGQIVPRGGK
jgi:hypothetical protein